MRACPCALTRPLFRLRPIGLALRPATALHQKSGTRSRGLLPPGEGGPKGRMRAHSRALTRLLFRLRPIGLALRPATLSRGERARSKMTPPILARCGPRATVLLSRGRALSNSLDRGRFVIEDFEDIFHGDLDRLPHVAVRL